VTEDRQPRKPSEPLAYWLFPPTGQGGPQLVIENLPGKKDALERAVIDKFVGTLASKSGRCLDPPEAGDEWPDFETKEGSTRIGIEVTEIINTAHVHERDLQRDYERHVRELLAEYLTELAGLHITLNDDYQLVQYPPLRRPAGRLLAESIAENLRQVLPEIRTLRVGQQFSYRWQGDGRTVPTTGAFGYRFASSDSKEAAHVGFFGAFPDDLSDIVSLLSVHVATKIAKHYTTYSGKLWLLLYETSPTVTVRKDEALALANALLEMDRERHHFDEVWYLFPYPEAERVDEPIGEQGLIERVWARS
jgi:hypothetical protein